MLRFLWNFMIWLLKTYLTRKYNCFYHQYFSSWWKLALKLSHFDIISKSDQFYLIEILKDTQKTCSKFFSGKSYWLFLIKYIIVERKSVISALNSVEQVFPRNFIKTTKNHIFIIFYSIYAQQDWLCDKIILEKNTA